MIEIVEILGRSLQGATRPFLCRGSDGNQYYVKGRDAGRRSLLCEWSAGHLAVALGLSIAKFAVVDVPQALLKFDIPGADLAALGAGPAFGSRVVMRSTEFTITDLRNTPKEEQQAVFVFDWWIRNGDRSLTAHGGNPNLRWDHDQNTLVVIDHNLAFAPDFDSEAFWATHVFAGQRSSVWEDLIERNRWSRRLAEALPEFAVACDSAPAEWWFEGDDTSIRANFDREAIEAELASCLSPDYWKTGP